MNLSSTTTAESNVEPKVGREPVSLPTLTQWLAPSDCVVATIDVQNDFCHPDGAIARMGNDVSPIEGMMSGIHKLVSLARRNGVPVVHVRTGLSEWFDTPAWRARGRLGGVFDAEATPVVREGTWGSELYQVEPRDDELILTKYRYSAFTYTPFELALRSKDCRTLILAGTATHQCVEATGREAIGLGFFPVIVREAVAARSHDQHSTALRDFEAHLGSVVTIEDLAYAWQAPPGARRGGVTDDGHD